MAPTFYLYIHIYIYIFAICFFHVQSVKGVHNSLGRYGAYTHSKRAAKKTAKTPNKN